MKSSALYSKINNAYKNIDIDSADYIKYAYKLVKSWCRQVVEINTEKGAIQNIVQSKQDPAWKNQIHKCHAASAR